MPGFWLHSGLAVGDCSLFADLKRGERIGGVNRGWKVRSPETRTGPPGGYKNEVRDVVGSIRDFVHRKG
jgi:hypothetical protein